MDRVLEYVCRKWQKLRKDDERVMKIYLAAPVVGNSPEVQEQIQNVANILYAYEDGKDHFRAKREEVELYIFYNIFKCHITEVRQRADHTICIEKLPFMEYNSCISGTISSSFSTIIQFITSGLKFRLLASTYFTSGSNCLIAFRNVSCPPKITVLFTVSYG